ncbi:LacI family transcriptional regulator [Sphingomonas spermidinifaciens]|uniref:LacI family transcriptional regulator n=1 Tax=Sphingomonas spermidinifaciens TaxID=1141889 RepID=A0A2A4B4E4_9SPHN|nr:LacI family DNA-binding transcriptional regulator [Sphingomonas spermidinifaciens]PCD02544.1 LacI family transcriptional regulator [Sphingomonas spermidinifaciens]
MTGGAPTIHDVAARAGVSIRTVSRVLNRSTKVNGETRGRIEAAIAALGFVPSLRARALATGRSFLIGLVHDDPNALVLDAVQRGLVAAASARGYEMVVHPAQGAGDLLVADIAAFTHRTRVDGLILLPPVCETPGLAVSLSTPAIALAAARIEGFATMLVSDEREAAGAVARHLMSLGHRRIGFVSGPPTLLSASERRAGFADALAAAGVPLDPALSVAGDYRSDSGVAAGEALLVRSDRPTAIFASNDMMAAGVLKVAARRGLSVPGALSVAGFDGSALATMLTPALTTVVRPLADMAARAADRLIDRIEGGEATGDLSATLTLSVGESTGPAPA